MISSINDKFREEIYESNTRESIIEYLLKHNKNKKDYILSLMISDWYKVNYVLQEEKTLSFLNNDIRNITDLCLNNHYFISVIYDEAKAFYNSPLIKKIIVMNSTSTTEEKRLYEIFKLHILDKIAYSFSYDLDDFNEYYLDFDKKNKDYANKNFIFDFITNEMQQLFMLNISKYIENIIVFMREYYKWNFYKKERLNDKPLFPNDYDFLKLIETLTFNNLVDVSIHNSDFLFTMIKDYLFYRNFTNEEENDRAKRFLIENTSSAFQKKLKIKG